MPQKIAVIGAGVIGLTTALRLLEDGFAVAVFARPTGNVTSRAAAALWMPYKVGPEDLVTQWGRRSLAVYQTLNHSAGVQILDVVELHKQHAGIPLWAKILGQHVDLPHSELPPAFTCGYTAKIHRIDTSIFLDYLITQIKNLGGVFIQQDLQTLGQINPHFEILINCSGVGANKLVPDAEVFPIRGQYLTVDKPAGLTKVTMAHLDENNYILIVPRTHDCWLGGNAIIGDWNTTVDEAFSNTLLTRAQNLEPLLKNVNIRSAGIGLRPGRSAIRLAPDQLEDGRKVIHNYGHGGGGYATAWGCAFDVVKLVQTQ